MGEQTAAPPRAERICRVATSADELERHFAIRHAVFVDEQAIFAGSDRDERDDNPETIAVVGLVGGTAYGAVRLYPVDAAGLWKGDRLAVLPEQRRGLLGATLVRFAVHTAGRRGGTRMIASVQAPNLHFFEWLGWRVDGPAGEFHGVTHVPVTIGLGPARGR